MASKGWIAAAAIASLYLLWRRRRHRYSDVDLLAALIHGEAATEPLIGKQAVAYVARNRVLDPRWPNTYEGVILQPYQFTAVWDAYRNGRLTELIAKATPDERRLADLVITGRLIDPTGGATHYHADYITPPEWTQGMEFKGKIGSHLFYKE